MARFDKPPHVRQRLGFALETIEELAVAEAIEMEDVDAVWARTEAALPIKVEDFIEDATILAAQIYLGRPLAGRVAPFDEREAHQARYRRGDVDVARGGVGDARPGAGPGEDEGRARLDNVERTVLAQLATERVALRVEHEIGSVRAVEELSDALVRVRVR
jgi:hypothetical protein